MTEDQARSALLAHGVPEQVFTLWEGPDVSPLGLFWSKPWFGIEQDLERHAPRLQGLCPLLGEKDEATLGRLPDGAFVRFYHEDGLLGDAGIEVLGQNYQQFVGRLILQLEDAGLRADATLAAAVLGFAHASELRALLDAEPYHEQAVEDFVVQLGNIPGGG